MKRILFMLSLLFCIQIGAMENNGKFTLVHDLQELQAGLAFIPGCQNLFALLERVAYNIEKDEFDDAVYEFNELYDHLKENIDPRNERASQVLQEAYRIRCNLYAYGYSSNPKLHALQESYTRPKRTRKKTSSPLREIHTNIID